MDKDWELQYESHFTKKKLNKCGSIIVNHILRYGLRGKIDVLKKDDILNKMFVSKDYKTKGNKSFNSSDFKEFRTILFIKDKALRENLGHIAYDLGLELGYKEQYGFTPKIGIVDLLKDNNQDLAQNSILSIDMQKAFDGINEEKVRFLFRRVLKVNRLDTNRLVNLCCHDGFLYQGCPISPIIFNLFIFLPITELNRCGIRTISYADDVNIISKYNYVSWKFIKFIKRIFNKHGFILNDAKTKILRSVKGFSILGFSVFNGGTIQASKLSYRKRLVKFYNRINSKGIIPDISENKLIFQQKAEGIKNFIFEMQFFYCNKEIKNYYRKYY